MQFVERYYKKPDSIKTIHFKNKVEAKREDIFVMSFFAWLKSKIENKPLYKATLELVTKAQAVN